MSSVSKLVGWVLALLVVAGVVWMVWDKYSGGVWDAGREQSEDVLTTSPSDTSSTALDADTAAIDAELGNLDADVSSIDQGITAGALQ